MLAGSGAKKPDERWATARGAQGSSTRNDSAAHCVVTDPELQPDLNQGEAVGIRSRQVGLIRGTQTGLSLSRIFTDGATLIGEPGGPGGASTARDPLITWEIRVLSGFRGFENHLRRSTNADFSRGGVH